jgi:hypothetical protein
VANCRECGDEFQEGQAIFSVTLTPLTPGRWSKIKKSVRPICACCASIHAERAEGGFRKYREEQAKLFREKGLPIPPEFVGPEPIEREWREHPNWKGSEPGGA